MRYLNLFVDMIVIYVILMLTREVRNMIGSIHFTAEEYSDFVSVLREYIITKDTETEWDVKKLGLVEDIISTFEEVEDYGESEGLLQITMEFHRE